MLSKPKLLISSLVIAVISSAIYLNRTENAFNAPIQKAQSDNVMGIVGDNGQALLVNTKTDQNIDSVFTNKATPLSLNCKVSACTRDTPVKGIASPAQAFYFCPTQTLADYANTTLGMVSMEIAINGQKPKSDALTGEPLLPKQPKKIIAQLRQVAGVQGFSAVEKSCQLIKQSFTATVADYPLNDDDSFTRQMQVKLDNGQMVWAPKFYFEKLN